jgi:hypothetical protein
MNRTFTDTPLFRKVLQSIWHQVNNGQEIYVVGQILEDGTVKGGTGWGAEFMKLCNKPLYVFDRKKTDGADGPAAHDLNLIPGSPIRTSQEQELESLQRMGTGPSI